MALALRVVWLDNLSMRPIFRYLPLLFLWSTAALATSPRVAIDVGHGLSDSGAISARGRSEFAFNLELAQVLAQTLRDMEFIVQEVNFDGMIGGLSERPLRAVGSDLFVSVHHDSISESFLGVWDWDGSEQRYTDIKRGFGLFVSNRNPDLPRSLRCASAMGAALRQAGFLPTPWHGRKHLAADADNGVWYYDNLVVLHRTTLPAVLFEAGVIKHREEELELLDPERQQRMSQALAVGLKSCLPPRGKSVPVSGQPQKVF
jgi:N-acetylmuramoyl-L-alanine amidase